MKYTGNKHQRGTSEELNRQNTYRNLASNISNDYFCSEELMTNVDNMHLNKEKLKYKDTSIIDHHNNVYTNISNLSIFSKNKNENSLLLNKYSHQPIHKMDKSITSNTNLSLCSEDLMLENRLYMNEYQNNKKLLKTKPLESILKNKYRMNSEVANDKMKLNLDNIKELEMKYTNSNIFTNDEANERINYLNNYVNQINSHKRVQSVNEPNKIVLYDKLHHNRANSTSDKFGLKSSSINLNSNYTSKKIKRDIVSNFSKSQNPSPNLLKNNDYLEQECRDLNIITEEGRKNNYTSFNKHNQHSHNEINNEFIKKDMDNTNNDLIKIRYDDKENRNNSNINLDIKKNSSVQLIKHIRSKTKSFVSQDGFSNKKQSKLESMEINNVKEKKKKGEKLLLQNLQSSNLEYDNDHEFDYIIDFRRHLGEREDERYSELLYSKIHIHEMISIILAMACKS
jgi:hypothetical protein